MSSTYVGTLSPIPPAKGEYIPFGIPVLIIFSTS